ncbi:MAG TPA: efflux RND transporter periplasmic adaptor subunit [Polyangiaceae bacterium]|nr:efflux RND transporter periplasmic adaptor subunit [Polyangiaceae bacterium]
MNNVNEPGLSSPLPTRSAAVSIVAATLAVLALVGGLLWRAERGANKVTLAANAKPVSVIEAVATKYRTRRAFIATVEPWVEAKLGPQLVSAYVDTVLVRPGAVVKRGEVLATLDCKSASAQSQNIAMQARALDARQKALASEATRLQGLVGKGFVAESEAELKTAQSAAEQAQFLAAQAKLLGTSFEVNDCVLRAPFDGEVGARFVDPGAFVRPGTAIVSVVDRSTIRITGDAPETDFGVVEPGTKVKVSLLATKRSMEAVISRRSPFADAATRTIHFEMDVGDPARSIPVGTTAELSIDVGEPMSVTEVPIVTATIKGAKASVFVVEGDVAKLRSVPIKGEGGGKLYLAQDLKPGARVVSEGRALLNDGDKVAAKLVPVYVPEANPSAPPASPAAPASGAKP